MPLISEAYRELNRKMHEEHRSYGISAGHFRVLVEKIMKDEGHKSLLDYGCGKGILKDECPTLPISEYDPAIPGKDVMPDPAELVVCIDVLEHIEPEHLNAVLRHMQGLCQRKILFSISLAPAKKTLADGRNPHLSLHDEVWWRRKMRRHFKIIAWDQFGDRVVGEGLPIRGNVLPIESMKGRKRRPMRPELNGFFKYVMDHSAKYADEIHRIKHINMFEGVGDKPSDSQMLCRIIEDCDDPDLMLQMACQMARISVMAVMQCTPEDAPLWRRMFDKRLRIVDWHTGDGLLHVNGSPAIGVQGIIAVGAVEDETRWNQVKLATKRFSRRIPHAPAHDKVAVVACYGPSLTDHIESVRQAQAAGGVVISVSGSHDMLLANGITPTYHVECDPRLHKADNMDHPVEGVQYLIASVVHPGYFDKLEAGGADIRLWHISASEHTTKLVDEYGEDPRHLISGGGSVGLRSIPLLYGMGYRNFAVYGMDSSFRVPPGTIERMQELMVDPNGEAEALRIAMEGVEQWAGKHAGKKQDICTVLCGGRLFVSSPILLTYATGFFETIQKMPDVGIRVYGDGLLKSMCEVYANLPQLQQETQAAA
jgi:hypothetical protein